MSGCLFVCLFICLLFVCLFVYMSVCLSVRFSVSVCLSVCLSVSLSVCLSVCFVCLSVSMSRHASLCLFVYMLFSTHFCVPIFKVWMLITSNVMSDVLFSLSHCVIIGYSYCYSCCWSKLQSRGSVSTHQINSLLQTESTSLPLYL